MDRPLVITVRTRENMVVQVTESGRLLVERKYDEGFFRSGRLDEYSAIASTGQGRLCCAGLPSAPHGRPDAFAAPEEGPRSSGSPVREPGACLLATLPRVLRASDSG